MDGFSLADLPDPDRSPYDELLNPDGTPRPYATPLIQYLQHLPEEELKARLSAIDVMIRSLGISFTVYSDGQNIDRAWPFDLVPRMIPANDWAEVEKGLKQRLVALNRFIDDIYNDQAVLKDGIVPRELVLNSKGYKPQCQGIKPKFGVWSHICGSDLVRDADGRFYVLEDNLRVPSGVSYMLENRQVMKKILPEMFEHIDISPVDDYTDRLYQTLAALAPVGIAQPNIVVLTPGIYNSAYFEHSYLAQQMGATLVEGQDLVVHDDQLFMKTLSGLEPVHVVYRRIDDEFLDPEVFREDSALGVPGIMRAWRAGNVAIANAPGAGVADDKVLYAFVPELIRYYLNEEPILANVTTYLCMDPEQRRMVLDNLDKLVVKPANESGGYGLLIGPRATAAERRQFAEQIDANPRNFIAQPTLSLSTCPTLIDGELKPRHLDLRPFILQSRNTYVTTGGLTRVALREGSLVVNSSQGGGSKDTWIVETTEGGK